MFTLSFLPWVHIPTLDLTLDGFHGTINEKLSFGKQGLVHGFFLFCMIILFATRRVWAKRVNMFVGMLNLAWAIKNFLLFSTCRPECPERQPALYLLIVFAIVIFLMTLLPRLPVKQKTA